MREEAMPVTPEARERSEALLREYLTPEQLADWEGNRAFNVRGSDGSLFRLTPALHGSHSSVVRRGPVRPTDPNEAKYYASPDGTHGLGICVWPHGLQVVPADWALALMLYLQANEDQVVRTGCHGTGPAYEINDYEGRL